MTKTALPLLAALALLAPASDALAARTGDTTDPERPAACLDVASSSQVSDDAVRFIVKAENTCYRTLEFHANLQLVTDGELRKAVPLESVGPTVLDFEMVRNRDELGYHRVCVEVVGTYTYRHRGRDITEPVEYVECDLAKY